MFSPKPFGYLEGLDASILLKKQKYNMYLVAPVSEKFWGFVPGAEMILTTDNGRAKDINQH